MSYHTPYRTKAAIEVIHPYFYGGLCGLHLYPTSETALTLRKNRIVLKQQTSSSWWLLSPAIRSFGLDDGSIDDVSLLFNLCPTKSDFYLFTESIKSDNPSWRLISIKQYGVYAQLSVKLSHVIEQENELANIECCCIEKFWEIICISKYSNHSNELKITEDKNRLAFKLEERTSIPGESSAVFRFVSTLAVSLKSSYLYQLKLWEVKLSGMHLLSSSIPIPQPTSTSILSSNTITSYLYF